MEALRQSLSLARSRTRQASLAGRISLPDTSQRFFATASAHLASQYRGYERLTARPSALKGSLLDSNSDKLICTRCRRQDLLQRTGARFMQTTPWRREPRHSDPPPPHGHVSDPLVDPSGRWNSQQTLSREEQPTPPAFQAPGSDVQTYEIYVPPILRAILFFLGVGGASFGIAAYASIEESRSLTRQKEAGGIFGDFKSFVIGTDGSDQRLRAVRKQDEAARMGERLKRILQTCESLRLPPALTEFVGRSYVMVAER